MITDVITTLATAEVVPNGGAAPGGLGQASAGRTSPAVAGLHLDPSGVTSVLRNPNDLGGGQRLMLNFDVTTSFACAGTAITTLEFQLVSLPIIASLLTDATTSGKQLAKTLVPFLIATDEFTIAGHNLPLGTPIHLTTITGGPGGIAVNTVYYVVPTGANTFKLATSLANAIASPAVTIDIITGDGDATVNFIPTVHASSGQLQLFNTPINASCLRAGVNFQVPIRPRAEFTTKHAAVQTGQTLKQRIGAGPDANTLATTTQRYYYLRYLPTNTITAGAINCQIVVDAGDPLNYAATGVEVI